MNDRTAPRRVWARFLAGVLSASVGLTAGADVVLEGFEGAKTYQTTGSTTRVSAADAVTEGAAALQLAPGAELTVKIAARAASPPGWLKIDTFENHPVVASLEIALGSAPAARGHVQPGKDTLAVPVSVASRADLNAWPAAAATLRVKNVSDHGIVVDNIRLSAAAAAPAGAVLLDFGPDDQVLWPGFRPAGGVGTGVTWKDGPTVNFALPYPDALTGDFSGKQLGLKVRETLNINDRPGPGAAWVWLTHYGHYYSPPLEYVAEINGRSVLRRRSSAAQLLTPDGLLIGRNKPWTAAWLEREFVPRVVSRVECPLKAGRNELALGNCQVAAAIIVDQRGRAAGQAYVQALDAELKRYRRQFVLAGHEEVRCDLAPDADETQSGMMVFDPPPDEWFARAYVPAADHRAREIAVTAGAGSLGTGAMAVVPIADASMLRAWAGALQSPTTGALPAGCCRIQAAETLPVVRGGSVYRQPFLLASSFRGAKARRTHWLVLEVKIPPRQPAGTYKGMIRLSHSRGTASVPISVDVFRLPASKKLPATTFGLYAAGDCFEAYRAMKTALPPAAQRRASQQLRSALVAAGFNAGGLAGPYFSPQGALVVAGVTTTLRDRLYLAGDGKRIVTILHALNHVQPLQPGTARYQAEVARLVKAMTDEAAKYGLTNYALDCGQATVQSAENIAHRAAAVRAAGGSPAAAAYAHDVAAMDAAVRARLLADLDTLMMYPGRSGVAAGKALRASGEGKTLLVRTLQPDALTCGFYCWAVGADGIVFGRAISHMPPFNAFLFDARSLLLPTTALGGFERTLAMTLVLQGRADFDLARRCEALAASAEARKVDAVELLGLLEQIRTACDAAPPDFDITRLRATSIPRTTLLKWRRDLLIEAGKLAKAMAKPISTPPGR